MRYGISKDGQGSLFFPADEHERLKAGEALTTERQIDGKRVLFVALMVEIKPEKPEGEE